MKIERSMQLQQLAAIIDLPIIDDAVHKMRMLLVAGFNGRDTDDIDKADWKALMEKSLRNDDREELREYLDVLHSGHPCGLCFAMNGEVSV